ncbi:MAG: hypothetical protein AB7T32_06980 [Dehalococcoidia bacterium]|jgi:hypothetical protein
MTSTDASLLAAQEMLSAVPTAGRGLVRLDLLGVEGEAVGRERFERLVTAIVSEQYPTARTIAANPGDWGIDTFVGELSQGTIAVWQSKYFLDGVGKTQQAEIRNSFASVQKAANERGFKVASWTLAVPINLDGPATKWWDGWSKRQQRDTKIVIDLWPGSRVESLVGKPDFVGVRQQFFGVTPGEALVERTVVDPADWSVFDQALFVRQLHEAGIFQDRVARRAFFNAEVMTRDVQEREVQRELDALGTVQAELHQMWHTRYEAARADCDGTATALPGLYPGVMTAVEAHHRASPSVVLRDTLIHRCGLIHHLVEAGHAGWVTDFDRISEAHRNGGTDE